MAKITIFGLAGSGKTTVGKIISEKLNYEFMSTGNIFRQMAKDNNMELNEFEDFTKGDEKYDRELDEVRVTEYGKNNKDFVMESRLAWHFIPDSIKIRLHCDDAERMRRVAERENKTIEKAKEETEHRENTIFEKYKTLYDIDDINDPNNFDLNINTTHNDASKVSEMILEFVETHK